MTQEIAQQASALDTQLRKAELLSQADMVPDKFKNKPANVLMAQEIASDMGENIWVTMTELYFVGNIPTFSAKYMRSRVRAAKHILRETFDPETMTATCTIIRYDDPDFEHIIRWDKKKAQDHGLWGKGHWKKNPELMLKNRAVSECVREACNEVMGGVSYTQEEAEAMQPVTATSRRLDDDRASEIKQLAQAPVKTTEQEPKWDEDSALSGIAAAKTQDYLREYMEALPEEVVTDTVKKAANTKWQELA